MTPPRASLYAKLGYAVAHGPFITSTNLYADDGRPIPVGAVMSYLTKALRASASRFNEVTATAGSDR